MAEENEGAGEDGDEKPPRNIKKLIVFALIGLLLLGGIGGAVWWFVLREPPAPPPAEGEALEGASAAEAVIDTEVIDEDAVIIDPLEAGYPKYVPVRPPLLTSYFQGERIRNFQLKSTLVTRNEDTESSIRAHMPRIANEFAVRMRELNLQQVMDPKVRLDLRGQLKDLVNNFLTSVGAPAEVEAVLFEQVIIQ